MARSKRSRTWSTSYFVRRSTGRIILCVSKGGAGSAGLSTSGSGADKNWIKKVNESKTNAKPVTESYKEDIKNKIQNILNNFIGNDYSKNPLQDSDSLTHSSIVKQINEECKIQMSQFAIGMDMTFDEIVETVMQHKT